VAYDTSDTQVLLQQNARDRLGWHGITSNELRWTGISDIGTAGAASRLAGLHSAIEADNTLAADIRDVVTAMPSLGQEIPTCHNEIKRTLLSRFSKAKKAEATIQHIRDAAETHTQKSIQPDLPPQSQPAPER
jgi:hypothetical protein